MRKSWDELFINIAKEYSTMSTCIRRHVGCVLVDAYNRPLSMGFNGPPPGAEHCDPDSSNYADKSDIIQCPGALEPPGLTDKPTGNLCRSNHSEANALLNCDTTKIHTCYTTTSPCTNCVKLLLCTSTVRIVFLEEYPGDESRTEWIRRMYTKRSARFGMELQHRYWIQFGGKTYSSER